MAPRAMSLAQSVMAMTPALCAIVFVPGLASAFIVPKASLMVASAATALVLIAFSSQSTQTISIRDPISVTLTTGVAWICLVTAVAPLNYMSASSATLIAAAVLIFACSLGMALGAKQLLFRSLAISGMLISALALGQFAFGLDLSAVFGDSSIQVGRMRVVGTLGNPDFAGEFLAACLPAVMCLPRKVTRWLLVAFISAAILCTGSRAAILAAFVSMLIWISMNREHPQRSRRAVLVAPALLACVASLWTVALWNPRSVQTALQGRTTIWRAALQETRFLGTGLGTFSYVYLPAVGTAMRSGVAINPNFITPERHAQNDLVEIIVETGPIGGTLAVLFLALWFRRVLRTRDQSACFAVATIASILTAAMFDFPLHRAETLSLFAISAAMPFARREQSTSTPIGQWLRRISVLLLGATLFVLSGLSVASSRFAKLGAEAESEARYRAAASLYMRAFALSPDNTDAAFAEARVLAQAERYPEALAAANRAARFIAEPELYLLRARILESMNGYVSAEREMELAAKIFPFSTIPQSELQEIRSNKRP